MTVLVTGGAGYIGAHACKALRAHGHTPVVLDNLVYGHADAVRWGPLVCGDLQDRPLIERVLREHAITAVVHFAAYAYVGESVRRPDVYFRNNVAGTLGLLEAMHACGVNRLVFSSTCAVYGTPEFTPLTESHTLRPVNPYGATKMMVERMLQDFATAFDWRTVSLRYFNAAGADGEMEAGERHAPETHLIPLALAAAAGHGPPLTVFGNDYPTPDGTCVRDYIHVSDLAEAHVLALNSLDAHPGARAFNLGTGHGYSVAQVIDVVREVTGRDVPFRMGERRAGDPAALVADNAMARSELGWQPRQGALRDIVASAWRFMQTQPVSV